MRATVLFAAFLVSVRAGALAPSVFGFEYFAFDDFFYLLRERRPATVEDALRLLPEEFFNNFTLVRESAAQQAGSAEFPRVILFGDTAHLVVTFNGHPAQREYNALETAEFDERTNRIFLRTIQLKKEGGDGAGADSSVRLRADEIAFENDLIRVSHPNPDACLVCHTVNRRDLPAEMAKPFRRRVVRYVWDDYSQWPRNWGEFDDEIRNVVPEFAALKRRLARRPRYRVLFDSKSKIESEFPYRAGDLRSLSRMPNTRLTILLSNHFATQTVEQLLRSEGGERLAEHIARRCGERWPSRDQTVDGRWRDFGLPFEVMSLLQVPPSTPTPDGMQYNMGLDSLGRFTLQQFAALRAGHPRRPISKQLLVNESIYDQFYGRISARTKVIVDWTRYFYVAGVCGGAPAARRDPD